MLHDLPILQTCTQGPNQVHHADCLLSAAERRGTIVLLSAAVSDILVTLHRCQHRGGRVK